MAIKTAFTMIGKPASFSLLNTAGQPVYTAAVPQPPVVVVPQTGLAPGGPGVQPPVRVAGPGPLDSIMNFVKNNPLLVIGGAVVVGLLMQKKRGR